MSKRTKKGGAVNNTTKAEYTQKINNYFTYCRRLQELYNKKHLEVSLLTDTLLRIENDMPNIPVNHRVVTDIIEAISNLPDIPTAAENLENLDKIQDTLMAQAMNNRTNIYRKINGLREEMGTEPAEAPRNNIVDMITRIEDNGAPVVPPFPGRVGNNVPLEPTTERNATGNIFVLPSSGDTPKGLIRPIRNSPIIPKLESSPILRNSPGRNTPRELNVETSIDLFGKGFLKKITPKSFENYKIHFENNLIHNFNNLLGGGLINKIQYNEEGEFYETDNEEKIIEYLKNIGNICYNLEKYFNQVSQLSSINKLIENEFLDIVKIPFKNESIEFGDPNQYFQILIINSVFSLKNLDTLKDTSLLRPEQIYFYEEYIRLFHDYVIFISQKELSDKFIREQEESYTETLNEEEIQFINDLNSGDLDTYISLYGGITKENLFNYPFIVREIIENVKVLRGERENPTVTDSGRIVKAEAVAPVVNNSKRGQTQTLVEAPAPEVEAVAPVVNNSKRGQTQTPAPAPAPAPAPEAEVEAVAPVVNNSKRGETQTLAEAQQTTNSPQGSAVLSTLPVLTGSLSEDTKIASLSGEFFNMKKKNPFKLEDYQQHLERCNRHNFEFIPVKVVGNLYSITYNNILNVKSKYEEIKKYLNHVQRVIRYVKIFQEEVLRLCTIHKRNYQQYIQVLKIPFINDADTYYPSDKKKYYTNLIERTSELFGYLFKIENKLFIDELLYKYEDLFYFIQLLISISPPDYIPEIKLSTEEIKTINYMPQENLDVYLIDLKESSMKREELLKNVNLSRQVIMSNLSDLWFNY